MLTQEDFEQLRAVTTIGHVGQEAVYLHAALSYSRERDGWGFLQHVPQQLRSLERAELVPLLKGEEEAVSGDVLLARARECGAGCGQYDAEWFVAHQADIPEHFRRFIIPFPRAIWAGPGWREFILCAVFRGGCWCIAFYWLGRTWERDTRFLLCMQQH